MPSVRLISSRASWISVSVLRPEEVHLEEADAFDLLHRPLRDDFVLLALVERDELGQRPRRDHDAGGMDRGMAGHALEAARDGEQLLDRGRPSAPCP